MPDINKNAGTRVLLLASYCGGDNPECSPDFPCPDCLEMCNVATAEIISVSGGFDYLRRARTALEGK